MTPEEMKRHIGKSVYITDKCFDWGKVANKNTYIIGVASYQFIVYKPSQHGGYKIRTDNECWIVSWDDLIIDEISTLSPSVPYPHKCMLCKSPSRNGDKLIFCSNLKCKVNKASKILLYHRNPND